MNKAKRAIEHMKAWGVGKYSKKQKSTLKQAPVLPQSHKELDKIMSDVRKQVGNIRRKK